MAEAELFDQARAAGGIGPRLLRAREDAGLTLGDVSARTRIAERHLAAIDDGRFTDFASRTYAVGFARAYARNVGLDEQMVADLVRAEMAESEDLAPSRPVTFEPGDPARVPGRRVAWLAALGAVALLVIVYLTWRSLVSPGIELPNLLPDTPPKATHAPATPLRPSAAPLATPAAPVVFTALEPNIWVKFYDAAGTQLMQRQMALGESYTVPAEAAGPRLWTGRPDALRVTIGGQVVAPLADHQRIMKDVPVDAAALLARRATPTPGPTPAPTLAPTLAPTRAPGVAARAAPSPGTLPPAPPVAATSPVG